MASIMTAAGGKGNDRSAPHLVCGVRKGSALDKLREECGIFAIVGNPEAARLTYLGSLRAPAPGPGIGRHRQLGRQALHIAEGHGATWPTSSTQPRLEQLPGDSAIGHVRYSTAGESALTNAQPILVDCWRGQIALAHNGNLINAAHLRRELERDGAIFHSTSDSEVILHLLSRSKRRTLLGSASPRRCSIVQGAYSLVVLTPEYLLVARDPRGFRPLCIGRVEGRYVVASETCAFDLIDAEYVREVEPGEVLVDRGRLHGIAVPAVRRRSRRTASSSTSTSAGPTAWSSAAQSTPAAGCWEIPGARAPGRSRRRRAGARLGRVRPRSATRSESGIPFEFGLIRNHYVGPDLHRAQAVDPQLRRQGEAQPVRESSQASASSWWTTPSCAARPAGRSCRSSAPPAPGDPPADHLAAHHRPLLLRHRHADEARADRLVQSVEEIRRFIGADSLGYLSLEAMMESVEDSERFCSACFTDRYPTDVAHEEQQKELFGKNLVELLIAPDPDDGALCSPVTPGSSQAAIPEAQSSDSDGNPDVEDDLRRRRVDIDAADRGKKTHPRTWRAGTFTPGVLTDIGSFGALFRLDTERYRDRCWSRAATASGTKLKIAFMTGIHDTVGLRPGLPLCLRHHGAGRPAAVLPRLHRLRQARARGRGAGRRGLGARLHAKRGCALIGGETAEMPDFYAPGEYDLAGFIVGVVDRREADRRVRASCRGRAARAALRWAAHQRLLAGAQAVFRSAGAAARRSVCRNSEAPSRECCWRRTAAICRCVEPLLDNGLIKGMAHITGGGITDNLPRILPAGTRPLIRKGTWPVLPDFRFMQDRAAIEDAEMYRTFNMGIGMVLVVGSREKLRRCGTALLGARRAVL